MFVVISCVFISATEKSLSNTAPDGVNNLHFNGIKVFTTSLSGHRITPNTRAGCGENNDWRIRVNQSLGAPFVSLRRVEARFASAELKARRLKTENQV